MIMRILFLLEAFFFFLNKDELNQVCGVVYRRILSCDFDENPISSLARDTVPRTTLSSKCGSGKEAGLEARQT